MNLTESQRRVLEKYKLNPKVKASEIARELGISRQAIGYTKSILIRKNYLKPLIVTKTTQEGYLVVD